MNKRLTLLGVSLLIIAVIYSACAAPAPAPAAAPAPAEVAATEPAAQAGSLLDIVKGRGRLICGVNNQVPGFGNVDANGNYSGFDVDFCKAVAAAVLGDANAVEYRYASGTDRFTLVKSGE
ncbi:MAG: amino acid ABC transporter substrate-binding protein, partial [Candidatus Thermofonsia Clade 3 bacterium]